MHHQFSALTSCYNENNKSDNYRCKDVINRCSISHFLDQTWMDLAKEIRRQVQGELTLKYILCSHFHFKNVSNVVFIIFFITPSVFSPLKVPTTISLSM